MINIALSGTSSILASIVGVVALTFVVIKLVQRFVAYRKWVAIYDAMPGDVDQKHWLWGHFHLVRIYHNKYDHEQSPHTCNYHL